MNDLFETTDGIQRNTERIKKNGEVFTPACLIQYLCKNVSDKDWADPTKTFLDPTCGNGQILCYILEKRLEHGVSKKDAISTLFGIELMEDNVQICKQRLREILQTNKFDDIINHNIVCSNIFYWNIAEWCPRKDKFIVKHKRANVNSSINHKLF